MIKAVYIIAGKDIHTALLDDPNVDLNKREYAGVRGSARVLSAIVPGA
jgi:hypothetical protein